MATGPGRSGTRLQVLYDYDYTTDYGRHISIKEGEECLLLKKANDNWWFVVKVGEKKPLYVPATYVKVIYKTVIDIAGSTDEGSEIHYEQTSFDEGIEAPTNEVPSPTAPSGGEIVKPDTEAQTPNSDMTSKKTIAPPSPPVTEEITLKSEHKNNVIEKRSSFKTFQKFANDTDDCKIEANVQKSNSIKADPVCKTASDALTSNSQVISAAAQGEVDYVNLDDYRVSAGLPKLVVQQPSQEQPDYANLEMIQESIRKRKEEEKSPLDGVDETKPALQKDDTDLHVEKAEEEKSPQKREKSDPVRVLNEIWEVHRDSQSGKEYYYNVQTSETSWQPPDSLAQEADSQESDRQSSEAVEEVSSPPACPASPVVLPDGWKEEKDDKGDNYFFNDITKEKWYSSVDDSGRVYFYNENKKQSLWALPQLTSPTSSTAAESKVSDEEGADLRRKDFQQLRSSWATWGTVDVADIRRTSLPPGAISSVSPKNTLERAKKEESPLTASQSNHGNAENKQQPPSSANDSISSMVAFIKQSFDRRPSNYNSASLLPINEYFPASMEDLVTDVRGILNKTKITDAHKKVKKNWDKCYAVLTENILYFYKDQKAAAPRSSSSIGKPDTMMDVQGASVSFGSKEKTSKKNTIQLSISTGTEYLLQIDDPTRLHAWYISLSYAAKQKGLDTSDDSLDMEKKDMLDVEGPSSPKSKHNRRTSKKLSKSATVDEGFELTEEKKKKIRERLRKFLRKRPTPEALQEKGIIKESVFGSHLALLCEREKSAVPKFVLKIVEAIEKKGLDVDGIYRVNGNLAQVQKLRFMVDHTNSDWYNFENPDWDIHVLTSALKLFFRELKEPVFPFKFLNKFTAALQLPDSATKLKAFHDLIRVLPRSNRETLKVLFQHLTLVMGCSSENRMQSQNIAIVFGPTLMWAEVETMSMAVSMVCQTQIVDYLLLEYNNVFS